MVRTQQSKALVCHRGLSTRCRSAWAGSVVPLVARICTSTIVIGGVGFASSVAFCVVFSDLKGGPMADSDSAAPGGAAQRRRARRLRQFLHHEKLSVAMHLAAATHHSHGRSGVDASTQTETYAASAPVAGYIAPAPVNVNIAPLSLPRPAPRPLLTSVLLTSWMLLCLSSSTLTRWWMCQSSRLCRFLRCRSLRNR